MALSIRALAGVVLVLILGCTTAKVVREGSGWREIETKDGKTEIQITSSDPKVLAEIARTHADPKIRGQAQAQIGDPAALAEIVPGEKDAALRRRMVERLTDEALLRRLAGSDSDDGIRQAASARADMLKTVDPKHPEFAGWNGCKPGTWVRWKVEVKTLGEKSQVEIVRTLLECCPERVVLEQKVAATGKPLQGVPRDFLTRFDVAYGRKVEDEGTMQLQGRSTTCKWVRHNFQRGGDIAQVRRWMASDVPGGVARIDMEVSPEGQPLSSLMAVATSWERK
ncbi:MAG: HEAT repeat domain-containing protein [Planctomycetaceae bacterium]|nr:HEAT repeat domain-containing protein [Planctomycetaceae bacterium]